MIIYFVRKQKRPKSAEFQPMYQDYYYDTTPQETEQDYVTPAPLPPVGQFYCPFCGQIITQPKKFCPKCGESLIFNDENE